MLNELAEKILLLGQMEEISRHAEADYEREPENAEYEARFDAAYATEFKYYMQCVKLVQQISGGKIDFGAAKKLVQTRRGELIEIIKKNRITRKARGASRERCKPVAPRGGAHGLKSKYRRARK